MLRIAKEVKGVFRRRRGGCEREKKCGGGRGRSTEGEADARALDACVQIIILMRFTETGTKCRGRGGGGIWEIPHDTKKKERQRVMK